LFDKSQEEYPSDEEQNRPESYTITNQCYIVEDDSDDDGYDPEDLSRTSSKPRMVTGLFFFTRFISFVRLGCFVFFLLCFGYAHKFICISFYGSIFGVTFPRIGARFGESYFLEKIKHLGEFHGCYDQKNKLGTRDHFYELHRLRLRFEQSGESVVYSADSVFYFFDSSCSDVERLFGGHHPYGIRSSHHCFSKFPRLFDYSFGIADFFELNINNLSELII